MKQPQHWQRSAQKLSDCYGAGEGVRIWIVSTELRCHLPRRFQNLAMARCRQEVVVHRLSLGKKPVAPLVSGEAWMKDYTSRIAVSGNGRLRCRQKTRPAVHGTLGPPRPLLLNPRPKASKPLKPRKLRSPETPKPYSTICKFPKTPNPS